MISARLLPLLFAVFSGCLYAPPLEERTDVDSPPVLREVTPDPTQEEHIVVEDADEPMAFRIGTVEDQNLDDTVYVRWFVDYDPAFPILQDLDRHPPVGTVVRPTAWLLDVRPCSAVATASDRRFYVEAIVSDRDFDDDVLPKFRRLPADALSVHLGWRVRIDEAAVCP